VGYFAQPQLVDVNRDGLLDIIIGEQDGSINYCPNTGTSTIAVFDTTIKNFGGVDVDTNFISTGYSSPKLIDSSGVYQLFVGSYTGTIYQFTNIDGNLSGQFTPINSTASNIWDGGKCAFDLADINNDNQPEMILGNLSGGISYFSSDSSVIVTPTWDCNPIQGCYDPGTGQGAYISLASCTTACIGTAINEVTSELLIYPNPATDKLVVESNAKGIVYIKNLLGKTIYKTRKSDYLLEVNISHFAKGIYILQLNGMSSKVLIQ
jgi:hypothetical protein